MSSRSRSSTTSRWSATAPTTSPASTKWDRRPAAKLLEQYGTARQPHRARRRDTRQGRREPARRARDARAVAPARDHPHRPRSAPVARRAQAPAPPISRRCASCTRATSCARCCASSRAASAAAAAAAGPAAQPRRRRAPAAAPAAPPTPPRHYETRTRGRISSAGSPTLRDAELFAFDTETTSLDYMKAEIVGVSFCIEPGIAAYVPLGHVYAGAPEQLRARRCSRSSSRCWRTRRAARSATTSSTTRTCSPTPASTWPACATTPCSSPTCGTASPPATTWTRRAALSGDAHHHLRGRGRAKAPSRSPSTRCRWSAPANTPPRTPT